MSNELNFNPNRPVVPYVNNDDSVIGAGEENKTYSSPLLNFANKGGSDAFTIDVRPTRAELPSVFDGFTAAVNKGLEGHYVNPDGRDVPDGERPSERAGVKYYRKTPSADAKTQQLRDDYEAKRKAREEAFAAFKAHSEAQGSIKKGGFNPYKEETVDFSTRYEDNTTDEQKRAFFNWRETMGKIDGANSTAHKIDRTDGYNGR